LANPATVKAGDLVKTGAIGKVIQVSGFGPHRLNAPTRPAWFFEREKYGGILTDIASHQLDQFLFFSGATGGKIVASHVANFHHPQYPELEDFGEVLVHGDNGTSGYFRVDWFTPDGLGVWGDTRLTILGTDGYIEIRKNCDIGGKPGDNHLFWVDQKDTHYLDCRNLPLPYGEQLLNDITNRTETAMSQAHCFMAAQLALLAQAQAQPLAKKEEK
jgi:predicted dehydrogenase